MATRPFMETWRPTAGSMDLRNRLRRMASRRMDMLADLTPATHTPTVPEVSQETIRNVLDLTDSGPTGRPPSFLRTNPVSFSEMDLNTLQEIRSFLTSIDDTPVFTEENVTQFLDSPFIDLFPEVKLLLQRSIVDWGSPPNYTKEYRQIRWPGNIEVGERTPNWRLRIKGWESQMRTLGNMERNPNFNRIWPKKNAILNRTWQNLRDCIDHGIPFHSKSLEYKPNEFSLYLNGIKILRISPTKGCVDYITYGGVYDKRVAFVLRNMFGLHVTSCKKVPTLSYTYDPAYHIYSIESATTNQFSSAPFPVRFVTHTITNLHEIVSLRDIKLVRTYERQRSTSYIPNPINVLYSRRVYIRYNMFHTDFKQRLNEQ